MISGHIACRVFALPVWVRPEPATASNWPLLISKAPLTVASVKVEEAVFGRVDENTVPRLREGWRTLLGGGLKAHVERPQP